MNRRQFLIWISISTRRANCRDNKTAKKQVTVWINMKKIHQNLKNIFPFTRDRLYFYSTLKNQQLMFPQKGCAKFLLMFMDHFWNIPKHLWICWSPHIFPSTPSENRKHSGPQSKSIIIPSVQTKPKTDFTGFCLTMPTLEGDTALCAPDLCLDTGWCAAAKLWAAGQRGRENEKAILAFS